MQIQFKAGGQDRPGESDAVAGFLRDRPHASLVRVRRSWPARRRSLDLRFEVGSTSAVSLEDMGGAQLEIYPSRSASDTPTSIDSAVIGSSPSCRCAAPALAAPHLLTGIVGCDRSDLRVVGFPHHPALTTWERDQGSSHRGDVSALPHDRVDRGCRSAKRSTDLW